MTHRLVILVMIKVLRERGFGNGTGLAQKPGDTCCSFSLTLTAGCGQDLHPITGPNDQPFTNDRAVHQGAKGRGACFIGESEALPHAYRRGLMIESYKK